MQTQNKNWEGTKAYNTLSDKLREELADNPPDEGEIFSILDLLLFSLETEENAYMGNIGLRVSTSLVNTLCDLDQSFGHGIMRQLRLLWHGPTLLEQLIRKSSELRNSLGLCTNMMSTVKKSQLVQFVERSGGTLTTPVIRKWLDARSLKFTADDWKKLMV